MRATITAMAFGACLLMLTVATDARGQESSGQQLGESLSVQSPSGVGSQRLETVGTLQGTERYLRRNKRPTDFVGSDGREARRFVGALQAHARGTAPSSLQGLTRRIDRSETMNQPVAPAPRGRMYYPRLELSLEAPLVGATDHPVRRALDTLARSPHVNGASRIAVSMVGRTAILQGEVPSAKDLEVAELVLLFEPGISEIQNELTVNPDLSESADSLSARRPARTPAEAWTTVNPRQW